MSYKSKHTGQEVDDAVDKVKSIGNADIATTEGVATAIAEAITNVINASY